jgi:hypothetical protein
MKRSNYIFESVLIAITALAGFIALFSFDGTILGALWLIVLGTLQIFHSIIIGANYWSHEGVQKSIIIYWCGVALNFIIMFLGNTLTRSNNIEMVTMLIFPLMLAVYLWWITYAYRVKPVALEPIEKV